MADEPVLMFHIGSDNWQRQGEFAPGSGMIHKAMHDTFNGMPGVKCYSLYPSRRQTDPDDDSTFRIFKLDHDIPVCEGASSHSSYRWHTMEDTQFLAYAQRLESEICAFMDEIEKKEGRSFDFLVSHHAFANAMTGAQVVDRRQRQGNGKLRHFNFVHGAALQMYMKEKENDPEYPMRFLHLAQSHGVFNSLQGCAGAWAISQDYIQKFTACFPAYPEDNLVFSRVGVDQLLYRPKGTTVEADLARHLREGDRERFAAAGVKRVVIFVGEFVDWKRLDVLLYAAEQYEKNFADMGTLIVGTGSPEDVEKYEGLAKSLGLERAFFLGHKPQQEDVADLLSMAEVGIFPSYKESFGMIFLECMACGTPVIGAKSGGAMELVSDDLGALFPEEEQWRTEAGSRRLGERLSNMVSLSQVSNWKGMSKGKNCVPFVQANYSILAQCQNMLKNMKEWSKGGEAEEEPEGEVQNLALADGRKVKVCEDEVCITMALVEEVTKIANLAIKAKDAFSICLPGGSIVQSLDKLPKKKIDWSKVHVFFVNERIGEYKTFKNANKSFMKKFGIPAENVHKVPDGAPEEVAAAYEATLRGQPRNVVGLSPGGMLSVDLLLLGTGEDGHVGSLHPNKPATKASGEGKVVLPISEDGKSSIAVSMDFICAAKRVILSAAMEKRAPMVARALQCGCSSFECPASMVHAKETTWLVDQESIKDYNEKQVSEPPLASYKSFWDLPGMKAGVITGDLAWLLLQYAKAKGFAIPAFNCTSTSSVNAVLEAGKKLNRPVIVQFSEGGSAFFAGKSLPNDRKQASILGAVAGAHFVRSVAPAYGIPVLVHSDHCAKKLLPWFDGMLDFDEAFFRYKGEPLFSSHMLDLSEEPHEENLSICKTYLERMAKMNLILEMEIGITGGVEDGVDNSGVAKDKLYSTPEEVWQVYETLNPISEKFTIAAAFGNVHGVYKPGNVVLRPELLGQFQAYASKALGGAQKPLFFVFHGGSGSEKKQIDEARSYGVVKMNVDTDTQWAYWEGLLNFYKKNEGYLQGQIGNPTGADKPNKSYYDPRKWVRESEVSMVNRVIESCTDLQNIN